MAGPRAWLAEHASKRADPNKWVFFGVAWTACLGSAVTFFTAYTTLYPTELKILDVDMSLYVHDPK